MKLEGGSFPTPDANAAGRCRPPVRSSGDVGGDSEGGRAEKCPESRFNGEVSGRRAGPTAAIQSLPPLGPARTISTKAHKRSGRVAPHLPNMG